MRANVATGVRAVHIERRYSSEVHASESTKMEKEGNRSRSSDHSARISFDKGNAVSPHPPILATTNGSWLP